MLRALLLLLLLANGLFWAWTQGWLAPVGMAPTVQREPERLQQQLAADQVRVVSTGSSTASTTQTSRPASPSRAASVPVSSADADNPACLQTAALDAAAASSVEAALAQALPTRPWQRVDAPKASTPYTVAITGLNTAALQTKQTELQRIAVSSEPLRSSNGATSSLVLGRYPDRAAADAALAAFGKRGVRSAKVVSGQDAPPAVRLRIEPANNDIVAALRDWNAKAAEATVFRACPAP